MVRKNKTVEEMTLVVVKPSIKRRFNMYPSLSPRSKHTLVSPEDAFSIYVVKYVPLPTGGVGIAYQWQRELCATLGRI